MSRPEQAVFRLPGSALFIPIGLFIVATPLAAASVWTLPLYLLPVYGLFYVLITRTVADDRTIAAHIPLRTRRIAWADLDGFEFQGPRWAIAVTHEGKRIRLPMVRPRDLRRLAQVSGGRLYLGEDAAEQAELAADESSGTTRLPAGPEAPGGVATDPGDPADGRTDPADGRTDPAHGRTDPTVTGNVDAAEDSTVPAEPGGSAPVAQDAARAASSDDTGRRASPAE